MRPLNWLEKMLWRIGRRLFGPGQVLIHVDDGENTAAVWVDGPVEFSELDDRFGPGNWSL